MHNKYGQRRGVENQTMLDSPQSQNVCVLPENTACRPFRLAQMTFVDGKVKGFAAALGQLQQPCAGKRLYACISSFDPGANPPKSKQIYIESISLYMAS
jgi:hypothetical protein